MTPGRDEEESCLHVGPGEEAGLAAGKVLGAGPSLVLLTITFLF